MVGRRGQKAGCGPQKRFQDVPTQADMSLGAAALVLLGMPEKKDKSYVCRFEMQCPLGLESVINLENVNVCRIECTDIRYSPKIK